MAHHACPTTPRRAAFGCRREGRGLGHDPRVVMALAHAALNLGAVANLHF